MTSLQRELVTVPRVHRAWLPLVLAALLMTGCAPQYSRYDWTGFVSKYETLRFMAPASCSLFFQNPVAHDDAFFKVNHLEPVKGDPWSYTAELVGQDGMRHGRFVVSQRWTPAEITSAPWEVTKDKRFCNVLAEVPVSRDGRQPYYVEPEGAKTAEYNALTRTKPVSVLVLVLAGAALVFSFWGFERPADWCKWGGILLATVGAIMVLYYFNIEAPWEQYQQALTYLKFFEELPRTTGGDLLPISPQQLDYLVAGPPHPNLTQFHYEGFAWVAGGLISLWLLITSPLAVRGIYWLAVPLPLEELHEHTLRAGRAPTAAEITAAVLSACTGKAAWQHRIMQRKAEAFARNLNNIARHL